MENKKRVSKKAILIPSVVGVAVIAVALVLFFIMQATVSEVDKNTIANNIYVGTVDVSGLTKKEAKAEIKEELKKYKKETVILSAENSEEEVTLGELGFNVKDLDEVIDEAYSYGKDGLLWRRYER